MKNIEMTKESFKKQGKKWVLIDSEMICMIA